MNRYYQQLWCTVALSLCVSQLFAQQVYLKPPGSGLQAYHPIKKWRGLDLESYLRGTGYFGGTYNTATGTDALMNANGSSLGNTADGTFALQGCTSCSNNVGVGYYALSEMSTATNNTGVGAFAVQINNASNNTGVGYGALSASPGSNNTGVGAYTLIRSEESNSVAIGYNSMYDGYATVGYNTAIGTNALYGSLATNGFGPGMTGNYNVVSGAYGMYNNVSGSSNVAAGYYAMYANTTGSENAASGALALYFNTTGYYNVANGYLAMYQNTSGTTNLADGIYALYGNTTGSDNTAVGGFATVSSGALSNATVVGYDASVSSSNSVVVGNTSVTSIGGYANWTNFSDGRYKKNIQQNVPGLAFINKLNPITYTLDVDGIEAKLHANDKSPSIKGIESKPNYLDDPIMKQAMKEKSAISYTGFVAQDVEKAADSVGFAFSGIDKPKDANQSFYGLRYGDFVVPIVKAVQELSAKSDSKDSVINAMQVATQAKFDSLQTQIIELKAMLLAKNSSAITGAFLDQNSPNPFTGSTTIGYTLPKGTSSAKMQITDVNGHVLGIIPLSGSAGKSTVTASLSGYAAGTYMYSLIVNGKLISTKQMTAIR